jgi:hypothetical protein
MKAGSFIKDALVPVVSVATAAMVAWLNYSVDERDQKIQMELNQINSKVTLNKEERSERESKQEFNLKIYEIVVESLEEKNVNKQEAAKVFVVAMVEDPLRSSLLSVLKQGGEPEVKAKVSQILEAEQKYKTQTGSLINIAADSAVSSFQWGEWDFYIFWCSVSGSTAKQQANLIGEQLLAEGAKGRVRIRELPESINAKAGFQISGYGIRQNDNPAEIKTAVALKKLSELALKNSDIKATFDVSFSDQSTAWYISAFVCPVTE